MELLKFGLFSFTTNFSTDFSKECAFKDQFFCHQNINKQL